MITRNLTHYSLQEALLEIDNLIVQIVESNKTETAQIIIKDGIVKTQLLKLFGLRGICPHVRDLPNSNITVTISPSHKYSYESP